VLLLLRVRLGCGAPERDSAAAPAASRGPRAMSQAAGVPAWLTAAVDAAVKPRKLSEGRKLLLLTVSPAAVVLGLFLLRHATHHGVFSAASATFTDASA